MSAATRFNFTKAALEGLPAAPVGQRVTYHDTRQPALSIRVTETGKKTFRVRGRPRGSLAVETLTIGPFPAVTIEQARDAAAEQLTKWARAESIVAKREADRHAEEERRRTGITFAEALTAYVDGKRRSKDGKPLKPRTRDDYLQMVAPGQPVADGMRATKPGELAGIAAMPLAALSAELIRSTFDTLATERGQMRAAYAMRVLRAVLNWHGVKIADNPLDKATAGRDRIQLPQTTGNPNPIPAERLGAWWRAACTLPEGAEDDPAGDYLRFLLLTGCRSIEVKGSKRKNIVFGAGIRVGDVDLVAKRVRLADTKNRTDHTIVLSRQAFEIVQRHAKGKTPAAQVFPVGDVRSRLEQINAASGVDITPHGLRATFATIAEELVSVYTLKRMVNHAAAGDVTGGHYIGKSEAQLRAGWQAVADFIEEQATTKGDAVTKEAEDRAA